MKNKTFFLVAIMMAIVLVSCEKEEVLFDTSTNSFSEFSKEGPVSSTSYRIYFDNGKQSGVEGVDYGCKGSGGGCLDEVTVFDIDPLLDWLMHWIIFSFENNDTEVVTEFFKENKVSLGDIFNEGLIDGVINETLTVSFRSGASSDEASTVYFKFRDNDGKLINVVPVKR